MSTRVRLQDQQQPTAGAMLSPSLPDEIMVDILRRLPMSSLIGFKRVCKTWYSLITTNPSFNTLHLNHSQTNNNDSVFLIKHLTQPDTDNYFDRFSTFSLLYYSFETGSVIKRVDLVDHLPFLRHINVKNIDIVCQCNGLVCLSYWDKYLIHPPQLFIWNPSLKGEFNFKALPVTRIPSAPDLAFKCSDSWTIGFGFDPKTNGYKVVRIWSFFGGNGSHPCNTVEVCRVGDHVWRQIDVDPGVPMYYVCSPLYAKGKCYWERRPVFQSLVSFDFSDEVFQVIALPDTRIAEHNNHWRRENVVVLKDSIALIVFTFEEDNDKIFEIRLMNEDSDGSGQISWTFFLRVEMPSSEMCPVAVFANGDVALQDEHQELHLYSSHTGAIKPLLTQCADSKMIVYSERLILFQGRRCALGTWQDAIRAGIIFP